MKRHELSKLFPPMSEGAIKELAADIKLNGLRSPIITHEGAILDGAQRERACKIARVPPHYAEFRELSPVLWRNGPLAFVVSENLRRRHLTPETQRELHRKLLPLVEQHMKEEAEKNRVSLASERKTRSKRGRKGEGRPKNDATKDEAVKQVAAMTGCSPATVYRNTSNGNHTSPKKPAPSVRYEDSVEMLIELARVSEGSLRVRLYDYIITVTYSPKEKLMPAVKTLHVKSCT